MERPAHDEVIATFFAANVDGQFPKRLYQYIDDICPDIVVLEECNANPRFPGYKVAERAPKVPGDRRSVWTFVRKPVKIKHNWLIRIWRRWRGPTYGRWHAGKAWTPLRLEIRGRILRFMGVHFPWGSRTERNRPAWNEAFRKAMRFLKRDTKAPSAMAGDVNMTEEEFLDLIKGEGLDCDFFGKVSCVVGMDCTVSAKHLDAASGHGWGHGVIKAPR